MENHIFQRMEKTYRRSAPIDFRAVSCSWQSQMSSFRANLDTLHPSLGDMNATEFIGRNIKYYSTKHLHVVA